MSMSATISLSPSTVLINQPVNATVTVSNSGSSAVSVTAIQLTSKLTGGSAQPISCAFSQAPLGQGLTTSVAASGSTAFPMAVVFFAPSSGPTGGSGGTFDVVASCSSNDGSNFASSAATVTVNPIAINYPASEQ